MRNLVIIGSNSIHCKRFIAAVNAQQQYNLSLITNSYMPEFAELPQLCVNFAVHNLVSSHQIKSFLQQSAAEVVHIHQANSYAWHSLRAIAKLRQRPRVILTAWGSDVLILPKRNKLFKKMVQYSLRHADIVTSDSLYMSSEIAELMAPCVRPIITLNFGLSDLPTKLNLSTKRKLILSNRLHKPLYRIDKIIQAFARLVTQQKISNEYQLVVTAAGEQTQALQELTMALGVSERVIFTGMLGYSDLVNYYQQANVFVSVPNSDGTASSLLEAMAYGCIPVLSNLPANLEWVLDQVNGLIAPNLECLDLQLLAAIAISEDNNRYQQLYDFNYQLIMTKASHSHNLAKFLALY